MGSASTESARRITASDCLLIALAAVLGVGAYLVASARTLGLGFPLDDSWIHETYARNLAVAGQWAFQLGQPSAGSTAPLWAALLTPGFMLQISPLAWSYLLGLCALIALGILSEWMVRRISSGYQSRLPWIGIFVVAEWHMLWAASSGMETLLHATLATAIMALLVTKTANPAALGLLVGATIWVRPDGITLAGPVLVALAAGVRAGSRARQIMAFLLGFTVLLGLFLAFNLRLSGTLMPNTFYAKQAEYAAWQAEPLLNRLGIGLLQLSTGPFLLLWPGLVASAIRIFRTRDAALGASLAWGLGYILLYLLRLPAYQHGRYLMPAMPVLMVLALLGYIDLRLQILSRARGWALALAWQWAIALLTLGFVVLGARSYAEDVALIESEMVDTAVWISENLPADAVMAAHDIGALGYFDRHTLIDLAGLVSPEVVPFIRDEDQLAGFLDDRGADYLVAFPDLYPKLVAGSRAVHMTGGRFAPPGLGNMTVYCWRCP